MVRWNFTIFGTSAEVTVITFGERERHPITIVATNRQSKMESLVFMKHLSPELAVAKPLSPTWPFLQARALPFDGKKAPSGTEGAFGSADHHP
jgi:hypothetical protein